MLISVAVEFDFILLSAWQPYEQRTLNDDINIKILKKENTRIVSSFQLKLSCKQISHARIKHTPSGNKNSRMEAAIKRVLIN